MRIIKHGIYYYDTVEIRCIKCDCKYEIKKEDIKDYIKPKKVKMCAFTDCWTEKYNHYTNCPECGYDNELGHRSYDILTTSIIGEHNENIS